MVSVNEPKRKPRSPNSKVYRTQALNMKPSLLDYGYTLDQCRDVFSKCDTWLDFINAHESEVSKLESQQERLDRDCVRYSGAF